MNDFNRINKFVELYYSGMSEREIAELYEISESAVSRVLTKAGATIRHPYKKECHCGKSIYKFNMCEYHYNKVYKNRGNNER